MKKIILLCFTVLAALTGFAQSYDTMEVHFGKNTSILSQTTSEFIDKMISRGVLAPRKKMMLLGYADYLGDKAHNDSLSEARAKTIKDYLVKSGFDPKDITACIGKGKIKRADTSSEGFAADRKVQIVFDHIPVKPAPTVIDVDKLRVNETIKLNNIFFVGGTATILPDSQPELDNLLHVMQASKGLKIKIEGHVCCMGPKEGLDDNNLSGRRAKAVYDFLTSNGISERRLTYEGMGNMNPVVKADSTEEDHIKNRRVEIRVISK